MSNDTPEEEKKPDNVMPGPFFQIPDYDAIKEFAAKQETMLDKATEALSRQIAAAFEEQLSKAIDNALGKGEWTMDDLAGRVEIHTFSDDYEIETIVLDGTPIFRYGPPKIEPAKDERGSQLMKATRFMEILNAGEQPRC